MTERPPPKPTWRVLQAPHNPRSPTWCSKGWLSNFRGNNKLVAMQFKRAADCLVDHLANGGTCGAGPPDGLLVPVGYLYRHALELELKIALKLAVRANAIPCGPTRTEHRLRVLWSLLRPAIERVWPTLEGEVMARQEALIADLDQMDPTGQNFRYARDTKGAATVDSYPDGVDLWELKQAFADAEDFLSAFCDSLCCD
jgi:hypothetical protein